MQVRQNILKDLDGIECPFTANTFYLACRKVAGHNFALVQIQELMSSQARTIASLIHICLQAYVAVAVNHMSCKSTISMRNTISSYPLRLKSMAIGSFRRLSSKLLALYASKYVKFKFANIGANLGWYSLLASKFTSHVTVDAFEPTPEFLAILPIALSSIS